MLYQDEYDTLMENITQHGYKKAEYFLACMNSAKKQSFESTYKKYHEDHIKRHKADLAEAKRTQTINNLIFKRGQAAYQEKIFALKINATKKKGGLYKPITL